MRAKIIVIPHDVLVKKLGLPHGAIVTNLKNELEFGSFRFQVHHPEYPEIPNGGYLIMNEMVRDES